MFSLMTDLALWDRLTGLAAACLAFGLAFGYFRVGLDPNASDRQRLFCASGCGFILLFIWEALRVRVYPQDQELWRIATVLFHLLGMLMSYFGLQSLYLMIPENDRDPWRWYTSPLYPPWGPTDCLKQLCREFRRLFQSSRRNNKDK